MYMYFDEKWNVCNFLINKVIKTKKSSIDMDKFKHVITLHLCVCISTAGGWVQNQVIYPSQCQCQSSTCKPLLTYLCCL